MGDRSEIRFVLNDRDIALSDWGASRSLLDFLRLDQRLTGSKEGCAEGDCGACTVLVGRLHHDGLRYETVNACIRFLASLDGCHVVTIEHLRGPGGALHPVQAAMVAAHGSQCGFCTPGIVMSLYALWMEGPAPDIARIETALQGNLCRCTGYAPIIRAAEEMHRHGGPEADILIRERETMTARLRALKDGRRVVTGPETDRAIIPADVDDLAAILTAQPEATIVAGATDVGLWVTKALRPIAPAVFVGALDGLKTIEAGSESESESESGAGAGSGAAAIRLGAGVTYSEAEAALTAAFPHLADYWRRIGGWQVRNMGTIGGNIANGSPIGDTPPVLIALGASITLRRGDRRRALPLEDFFIDYGRQDRAAGEFVESITIPRRQGDWRHAAYKISKRRDEDISSVAAGFALRLEDGVIREARLAFGGMAATPKRAAQAEAALRGQRPDA
ncbi:xanthine dehydrogenase small subunit, partial [Shimia sp.]|uniref:xanthine dehydrogenase small subunit n=1 Tax=Shimia sp. TaxID=1954381 RepID=UPI00356359A2